MKVKEIEYLRKRVGLGLEFFPYQLAVGVSLRYWPCIAFRLYVGPLKSWGYLLVGKNK